MIAPPQIWCVLVSNDFVIELPISFPTVAMGAPIWLTIPFICCAMAGVIRPCCTKPVIIPPRLPPAAVVKFEPKLLSALFCSLLNKEIVSLKYWYPPAASTLGRYFVLAAFRMFSAISCFIFETLICLLLRKANARQLSRLNVF